MPSEGQLNQAVMMSHKDVAAWKKAKVIRRPQIGGEPDLLVVDVTHALLYVVEGRKGEKLDRKEFFQLAGYAACFRHAPPRLLARACMRALEVVPGAARRNAEHLAIHGDEIRVDEDELTRLFAKTENWSVVPVLAVYGSQRKLDRLLAKPDVMGLLRDLGLEDLQILACTGSGSRIEMSLKPLKLG